MSGLMILMLSIVNTSGEDCVNQRGFTEADSDLAGCVKNQNRNIKVAS